MATADNIRKCADIVRANPRRSVIVVSAPGKFGSYNEKVTDQLLNGDISAVFLRFGNLANDLLPPTKLSVYNAELHIIKNKMLNSPNDSNYIISRGEYLTAKLFALYLDFNFVDAVDIIVINKDTTVDLTATKRNIRQQKLIHKIPFVMGGFYGAQAAQYKNKQIRANRHTARSKTANADTNNLTLLSRGGSDYTGAVISALLKSELYENWTDANGIQTADPRFIYGTRTIPCLNFDALHILTHNGATIIHENVAQVLKKYRLPLYIDNTFRPFKSWTEVHSGKCKKCSNNFFSTTHKGNIILVVSKKGKKIKTAIYPTSAETLTPDIQRIHNEYINYLTAK
jgi:aspartate kinase